jgi:hypothetical protein
MSNETLDRILNATLGVLAAAGGLFSILGVVALSLAIFSSGPQGYYVQAAETGYTSSVYQNIRFGQDRLVFYGPNGNAWQVFKMITEPPPVPESNFKTLELKDTVNL